MADLAAIASAIIAGVVAAGTGGKWLLSRREEQLRTDDVLIWANKSIAALQSVHLVCRLAQSHLTQQDASLRMQKLMFRTSILVEQGRLFFKNVPKGSFGLEKPEAYRGLRPLILDQLVAAHEVACAWNNAGEIERQKLGLVAEDSVRNFVSMVRSEVGRERTASGGVAKEGYGVHLKQLLPNITEKQLRDRHWL